MLSPERGGRVVISSRRGVKGMVCRSLEGRELHKVKKVEVMEGGRRLVGGSEVETVVLVASDVGVKGGEDQQGFLERYAGAVGHVWLYFGAFCAGALFLKWARKKQMEMSNEKPKNPTIITTEEMEADLHVFKCSECGYEMYPARTREFKFFPENFKCPVCSASKDAFWDLNDPNDPRNQEEEDEEEDEEEAKDDENDDTTTESLQNDATSEIDMDPSIKDQPSDNPNTKPPATNH